VEDSLTVRECTGLDRMSYLLLVDTFNSGLGHRKEKTSEVEEDDSYCTIGQPSSNYLSSNIMFYQN